MNLKNLIANHKESVLTSVLCLTVIATLFLTLKSNSLSNINSLADSNVEALSDVEKAGSSWRYDYFSNAKQAHDISPSGTYTAVNSCESGSGTCSVDKFCNYYLELDAISIINCLGENLREWVESLGEAIKNLPEAIIDFIMKYLG